MIYTPTLGTKNEKNSILLIICCNSEWLFNISQDEIK